MTQSKLSPTILFIVGSGRSGSTILDLAVGSNPSCFSVGEISDLRFEIENDGWCTCCNKYYDCEFWSKVDSSLKKYNQSIFKDFRFNLKYPRNESSSSIKKLRNLYYLLGIGTQIKGLIHDHKQLYSAVFENIDETVVVDSSKDIKRAVALYRNCGFSCKIIHLIRDVRGVSHSAQKKEYSAILPPDFKKKKFVTKEVRTTQETTSIWNKQNKLITTLLKLLVKKNDHFTVRYEDLIQHPEDTLKSICQWLKLNYHDDMINFGNKIHHNAGGNPSRFNSKKIIYFPEKWRKDLSEDERRHCEENSLKLMKKFNYI